MSTPLPQLRSIWADGVFLRIWAAIFLSATATFLLLLTLSAFAFSASGSAFIANGIVLTQWIPAILLLPLIKAVARRFGPRLLLAGCELGCLIVVLAVLPLLHEIYAMIALLLLRGAFDSLSKVSRASLLKLHFTGHHLEQAAAYYNTALLIGGAAGATVGALMLASVAVPVTVLACAVLYGLASGIYATLPAASNHAALAAPAAAEPARVLTASTGLAVALLIASVGLFQGYHNIARSVFPVDRLGLSDGIPLIQAVTSAAYIVGAFVAARLNIDGRRYHIIGIATYCAAIAAMALLPLVGAPWIGIPLYAAFALSFEMGFCIHLRVLITTASMQRFTGLMAETNAWGMGLMVLVSLSGSYLVDRVGFDAVTIGLALLAAAAGLALYLWPRRAPAIAAARLGS